MDPQLLPFAERQAPRYTSYPSANHFDASVNAETYGSWLRALSPDTSLSLYLHVPYCRELCWYCGCNTYLTRGGDIGDFVTALMMEVDLVASKLGSHRVGEIHWAAAHPMSSLPNSSAASYAKSTSGSTSRPMSRTLLSLIHAM